ncbi:hypothetical protein QJS04_geneDACA019814 [Acorus gramineus]|uniref:TLDc domain-containing protein n=1 Tax=Acorus gramineus TaxID=55184 RepID=A0AAV9BXQ9_ACOGR|nr:hypothetical protein QJS04_geneDACA019814 [Acorus gramineus]
MRNVVAVPSQNISPTLSLSLSPCRVVTKSLVSVNDSYSSSHLGLGFRIPSLRREMISWKDKVADKLSRLLADSSSPSTSSAGGGSPTVRPEPQAIPLFTEETASPKTTSFSSYLLSLVPTTNPSPNDLISNHCNGQHSLRPLPLRSLPVRWKFRGVSWKDELLDCSGEAGPESEKDETSKNLKDTLDHDYLRNINGTERIEEVSTSSDTAKSLPGVLDDSTFISSDLYDFFRSSLPNIVKGCQWGSTLKHGISLRTLLRKSADISGPCLLLIEQWSDLRFEEAFFYCQITGDMQGAIFGGLLDCPLKPTAKRKYQGTNQTFVFTTIYGEPRLFRATGANRYYYLCLNDLLALGGGESFALRLDEDLLHGTSGPSGTFGNLCLAHNPEFELKNVELWGFTHSSQYLV